MAVQHGRASRPLTLAVLANNKSPGIGAPNYNQSLLRQLYAQRSIYVTGVASKKSPNEKKTLLDVVKNRYPKEELDAFTAFLAGT